MNGLNFRVLLERRRKELESILTKSEPHNAVKSNFFHRFDLLKKRKAADQLDCVIEALQRIEDGTFGECINCGGFMSDQELLMFPEKKICNKCFSNTDSKQSPTAKSL